MSFLEKLRQLAISSQETRDANDKAFTLYSDALHKSLKNSKLYSLLAPIAPLISDIIDNMTLNAIVYSLFETLRKVWCDPEANQGTCSDSELEKIYKQASITELISFTSLLLLQSLWVAYIYYKKKKYLFDQNPEFYNKTEEKLMLIKNAVYDIFAQMFIPHKFFLVIATKIFHKDTMSTRNYIISYFLPSILLALLASTELLKVTTIFKPGKILTLLKNILTDMIGTGYRVAGQIDFSNVPQESLTKWTGKNLVIPTSLMTIIDAGIGFTWGIVAASKNFIPWYKKSDFIKAGVILNDLIKLFLLICTGFLVITMNNEQKKTSLGLDALITIWILTVATAIIKQIIDKHLEIPISKHQDGYQRILFSAPNLTLTPDPRFITENRDTEEDKEQLKPFLPPP